MNDDFSDHSEFLNQLKSLEPASSTTESAEVFYCAGYNAAQSERRSATSSRIPVLAATVLLLLAIPISYQLGSRHGFAVAKKQNAKPERSEDQVIQGERGTDVASETTPANQTQYAPTIVGDGNDRSNTRENAAPATKAIHVLAKSVLGSMANQLAENRRLEQMQAQTLTAFHASFIQENENLESWLNRLPGSSGNDTGHRFDDSKILAPRDAMEFQAFSTPGVQR